jgi:hypothetical protein
VIPILGDNGARDHSESNHTFFNGFIYAATNAVFVERNNNTNLNDFRQWEVITTGNWVVLRLLIAVNRC